MDNQRKIAKTYVKLGLSQQDSDFAYWQTQSHEKRLATLELIRQEYNAWKYGIQPRFQRVFTITER